MSEGKRDDHGRFIKGKSGNPTGRPKTELAAIRKQLAAAGPKVVKKLVDAALDGDTTACKVILDRICPPLKPAAAPVSLEIPEGAGLADVARTFITAAGDGRITTDTAAAMLAALGSASKVIEVDELERRIAALEEKER